MKILCVVGLLSIVTARASGQTLSQAQVIVSGEVLPMARKAVKSTQARVEDVGGVFIYANDPKGLAEWYQDKLGIELAYNAEEGDYFFVFVRGKDFGANAVFAIKPATSPLATEKNQFTVNFRVSDFDGIVERLKAKGVAVKTKDYPGFGQFGWIKDLEGNPVEFWQPKK